MQINIVSLTMINFKSTNIFSHLNLTKNVTRLTRLSIILEAVIFNDFNQPVSFNPNFKIKNCFSHFIHLKYKMSSG